MMNAMLMIMFGSEKFQRSVKVIVHGKRNPEDIQSVSGDVVKSGFLLFLDRFLEGADFRVIHNLDHEDVTGIIATRLTFSLVKTNNSMQILVGPNTPRVL